MSTILKVFCTAQLFWACAYSQDASVASSNAAAQTTSNNPTVAQTPDGETEAMIFKSIIPPRLVEDMFGNRISKGYLAIQVTVFNTSSDNDLLINDVSVDYGALIGPDTCASFSTATNIASSPLISSTAQTLAGRANIFSLQSQNVNVTPQAAQFLAATASSIAGFRRSKSVTEGRMQTPLAVCQTSSQELSILRGVAEKGQILDPRNIVYRSLQAAGTIGGALTGVAGLGPVLPKAVAAFNGPGLSAFTGAFPDFTLSQMNRLSDSAYAANTVVPKQRSKVLVAFIPLSLFFKPKDISQFRKDPYSAFMGISSSTKAPKAANGSSGGSVPATSVAVPIGLKDLKVRVAYNFIVSTEDVPPILSTVNIEDAEILNLPQNKEAHGMIVGRFMDGADVSSTDKDYEVKLDSTQASSDTRLYFVITPKKAMFPQSLNFTVAKGKVSSAIPKTITLPQPMPTLTSVDPQQIPQGADSTITLTGTNFFDLPATLSFFSNHNKDTSLLVSSVTVVSATQIKATISAKNAQPGVFSVVVNVGKQQTGEVQLTVKATP